MGVETDKLESAFKAASAAVHKGLGGKPGATAEKQYGQAYQLLVQAGLKPKLRSKFR